MTDLERAIQRLNNAIDAYEKRQAAKAIVGALVGFSYTLPLMPSSETIDGWSIEQIDSWWAELEPLVIDEVSG